MFLFNLIDLKKYLGNTADLITSVQQYGLALQQGVQNFSVSNISSTQEAIGYSQKVQMPGTAGIFN